MKVDAGMFCKGGLPSREEKNMSPESKSSQPNDQPANSAQTPEPAQHVAHAHQLLKSLTEKFGMEKHPELQEAITKLELALNQLTLNTGGML